MSKSMEEAKKYTMLVVDDEPVISDGLRRLFEENFGHLFRVYNCYHPKKALEIFKFRLPDVVVSDVKMPKMTGIEMAEEMRRIKADLHVLFLSGYDEFDYVYSAIKQDADDYILKMEGDDTILEAMKKMVMLLESENLFKEEFQTAQDKVSYMTPAFQQKAMFHILDGDIVTQAEFDALMADMENPIPANGKLVMVLGRTGEKVMQDTQEKILDAATQSLAKAFGEKVRYIHKTIYRKTFTWLLETEETELPGLLRVTLPDVQKMLRDKLDLSISFCIAQEGVEWGSLSVRFNSLWAQMERLSADFGDSIMMESQEIMISDSFGGEDADFEQIMTPLTERLHIMQEYLEGGNMEAFTEKLEEVLRALTSAKRHSMYALELYYSLANVLIGFINRRSIRPQLASRIRLMELFDPGSFATWEQAAGYIRRLRTAIEDVCEFSGQKTNAGITERTKTYILSHLGEDLSLAVIGQEMGFNPIYLSRVFKQAEGCSIREYIEGCRMDMARRMILSSHMKIYEIAEKCGYQNTAYFIKIFKSYFNITPQECRDRK